MSARGYSIAELLVALVVAGIVGISLSKLIINQSRFLQSQDNYRQARSGARSALSIPTDELRMVTSGGALLQASADSFTVRVPFVYGLVCGQSGGKTHIALFPADSATYAGATATGYVWRDTTGVLHYVDPITGIAAGSSTLCSTATPPVGVLSATGWSATVTAVAPNDVTTPVGAVAYLYRQIRYGFAPSAQLTGRKALWRVLLPANTRDELVAPFDSTAHFEYLVGDNLVVTQGTPAVLDSVEGVRFVLVGASVNNSPGGSAPSTFNITTDILFRNRALH